MMDSARRVWWKGSYLGDRLLTVLACAMAVFYTPWPTDQISGFSLAQAVLSWCFLPFVWLWRSRPIVSAAGFLTLLAMWGGVWILYLPGNLGIAPWLVTAPMAVYSTARFCSQRSIPRIVLAITLLGSIFSPVMWHLDDALNLHYRTGTNAILVVTSHWFLLIAVHFAGTRAYGKVLQRKAEMEAQLSQLHTAQEEERLLIARELHDVLAHSLTLIKVQAHAGLVAIKKEDQSATETLQDILETSESALAEVRDIVHALRSDAPTSLQPSHQLRDISVVVEGFRKAGLSIDARLPDQIPDASALCQLAVTRIVSESLTNALRHQGPDTQVQIELRYGQRVDISVVSRGQSSHVPQPGAHTGLIGLRERARSLGGTFSAEGTTELFEVHASIPLRSTQ